MIQKIFLLKNKLIILFSIIFIILVIFFYVKNTFNYDYFITKIEEETGFIVKDKGDFEITFTPNIKILQKNLKLEKKN